MNSQIFQEVLLKRRTEKWAAAEGGSTVQRGHFYKMKKKKTCLHVLEMIQPIDKEKLMI